MAESILDVFLRRAATSASALAFVQAGVGNGERRICYAELKLRARAIAISLNRQADRGPVMLAFENQLDFALAMVGCLIGRRMAVPVPFPTSRRGVERYRHIVSASGASCVLTTQASSTRNRELFSDIHVVECDTLEQPPVDDTTHPAIEMSDIAILQFTSGSTSNPKGVAITHGNITHNLRSIDEAFRHQSDSVILSWLPYFHDMGLIYGILGPLYTGCAGILMQPGTFLQNPFSWLELISRYRATHSGGPNFAYDLCAEHVTDAQLHSLDLSCWRVAFNGAEPVRSATLRTFVDRFSCAGFTPAALCPAYGLAESTLKVSARDPRKPLRILELDRRGLQRGKVSPARSAQSKASVVSCGSIADGLRVEIVHPETGVRCHPNRVGEIWVTGPSVAPQYWNLPAETEQILQARLADDHTHVYLKTGDLGFIRDDELYVIGRCKDVIVVRGTNHHASDIEDTVREAARLPASCMVAAFAIESARGEELAIVWEKPRPHADQCIDELNSSIRAAITECHGVDAKVVAVKPGGIPRTTSGKVQRAACRTRFERNSLPLLQGNRMHSGPSLPPTFSRPGEETELRMIRAVARIINIEPVASIFSRPLIALGLDSLRAAHLTTVLKAEFSIDTTPSELLSGVTLETLQNGAKSAVIQTGTSKEPDPAASEYRVVYPLTVDQTRLWLMQGLETGNSATYNLVAGVRIEGKLDQQRLVSAFRYIASRHEALRTHIVATNSTPEQHVSGQIDPEIEFRALQQVDLTQDAIENLAIEEAKRSFQLDRPPLFRVSVYSGSQNIAFLLLTAHHIICDGLSLAIILDEATRRYMGGWSCPAPPVQFGHYIARYPESVSLEQDCPSPCTQLDGLEVPPASSPRQERAHLRPGSFEPGFVRIEIGAGSYDRLRKQSADRNTTCFIWLLTVLQRMMSDARLNKTFVLAGAVSGRPPGFEESVGCFAHPAIFPLRDTRNESFLETLKQAHRVALNVYAQGDVPFAQLVRWARKRRLDIRPLFESMLSFLQVPSTAKQDECSLITPLDLPGGAAGWNLFWLLIERDRELSGWLQFNRRVITTETAVRWSRLFAECLRTSLEDSVNASEIALRESICANCE